MKGWQAALLALGVGGLGFYLGAKYALGQVHTGVVSGVDSAINAVGLNVNSGYGRVAHTLADTVVGDVLGG